MSYALDTNVLARNIEEAHPMHDISNQATETLIAHGETVCIFPQNLYELWVVVTRPVEQNGLGLTSSEAQTHLQGLEQIFPLMKDVPAIFAEWKSLVSQHSVTGKNAHDARIVAAMRVHGVSHLVTFNDQDFKRYDGITVLTPAEIIQAYPALPTE